MGLETVELVISWEQEFGISIPNKVAATLITPRHAGDAIERLLVSSGRAVERPAIDAVIKATTLDISGMDAAEYRIDGQFVEDFGMG